MIDQSDANLTLLDEVELNLASGKREKLVQVYTRMYFTQHSFGAATAASTVPFPFQKMKRRREKKS